MLHILDMPHICCICCIYTVYAAYADAAYESLKADAVTLSPYMGSESINPFIKDGSKGAFVICKTSNPSSKDLQECILNTVCNSGMKEANSLKLVTPLTSSTYIQHPKSSEIPFFKAKFLFSIPQIETHYFTKTCIIL